MMTSKRNVKVAVVYHTITGTTEALARSVVAGIDATDQVDSVLLKIEGRDIHEGRYVNPCTLELVTEAAGIIFGSPTFMGNVSAQFKAFADASSDLWDKQRWRGKIASGFTIGSNLSGDQLCTLQYLQILASQHGMLWSGIDIPGGYDPHGRNRLGAQSGLVAHSENGEIDPLDSETAIYLGQRVAMLVKPR